MGLEIERKYLVRGDAWRRGAVGVPFRQGYLSTVRERVVRVRTMGNRAALTVKGATRGATRLEFEYAIPVADANELLDLCEQPLIEKTRYHIPHGGLVWEVDVFHGVNEGLIIAECELEAEDQAVATPEWVGDEVTGDPRYANASLVARPYTTWG
ncbi:MAG: CYTH domain-containing protein [Candidatus Krumholzibacteriia bacterium]